MSSCFAFFCCWRWYDVHVINSNTNTTHWIETNYCLDFLALGCLRRSWRQYSLWDIMQEIVLRQKFHITTFYVSFYPVFPLFFFVNPVQICRKGMFELLVMQFYKRWLFNIFWNFFLLLQVELKMISDHFSHLFRQYISLIVSKKT